MASACGADLALRARGDETTSGASMPHSLGAYEAWQTGRSTQVGRQRLNQGAFVRQYGVPQALKLVAALRGCGNGAQHALLPFKKGLQVFHVGCQK